jgi:hypothetical protein
MVLLLREPRFLTLNELRAAAEKAFGVPFNGGKESRHFVIQKAMITQMKAGPHMLSFLNYTKPYGEEDFPKEFATSLLQDSQKRAWSEHKSWTAVDYVKGGADLELEYAVLARLCAEMLNSNCSGLYVPREQSLIPNDESLREDLLGIAASRSLGVS